MEDGVSGAIGRIVVANVMVEFNLWKENVNSHRNCKYYFLFMKIKVDYFLSFVFLSPSNGGKYCRGEKKRFRICNSHVS